MQSSLQTTVQIKAPVCAALKNKRRPMLPQPACPSRRNWFTAKFPHPSPPVCSIQRHRTASGDRHLANVTNVTAMPIRLERTVPEKSHAKPSFSLHPCPCADC
jgi:hypothetical protein